MRHASLILTLEYSERVSIRSIIFVDYRSMASRAAHTSPLFPVILTKYIPLGRPAVESSVSCSPTESMPSASLRTSRPVTSKIRTSATSAFAAVTVRSAKSRAGFGEISRDHAEEMELASTPAPLKVAYPVIGNDTWLLSPPLVSMSDASCAPTECGAKVTSTPSESPEASVAGKEIAPRLYAEAFGLIESCLVVPLAVPEL